jgi:hypothetical protein
MNLDDYKSNWKKQHNQLSADRFDAATADVVARAAKLETAIRRRDLIEAVGAVFVLVFFGVFLWCVPCPVIMQAGVVIVMLGAVEIVVVMHWTRHRDDEPTNDLPLLDFCTKEIKRVDRQIRLLRNVNWWYSGPILLGCSVAFFGLLHSLPEEFPDWQFYVFLIAFNACFLAAGFIVFRGNARAVLKQLVPVREELAELVRSLQDAV